MNKEKEEYIIDDRVIIPEDIRKMTSRERLMEIERLEREHLEKRKKEEVVV